MTGSEGSVWHESKRVGEVRGGAGRIEFRYDASWRECGFAISLALPLGGRWLDATAFFSGLLPEGRARERLRRQLRIGDDDLALLLEIGRDCAGALTILPGNVPPMQETARVAIDAAELVALVESQGQALPAASTRPRFSLAGAQDKIAVCIDDGAMWLPDDVHPSSHILKFETIKRVCFAEQAGAELAGRLGLPVASVTYRALGESPVVPYLELERYDRAGPSTRRRRLHQEDLTQALGYSSAQKYQEDGGPDLKAAAALIRHRTAEPTTDIAWLRDWQLFNYLIGNSDGHAKNLALLYPEHGGVPRLAPFYDLVCIEFLNRIGIRFARALAFHVGSRNVPEEIRREDWHDLADAIGVPKRSLVSRLLEMAERLPALATEVRADFARRHGDNQIYDRFEECIADRCRWTLATLSRR